VRRLFALLAVVAAMTIGVGPAMSADVSKVTVEGVGISAIWSNAQRDSDGAYLPGTYTELVLSGNDLVFTEGNDPAPYLEQAYVFVTYRRFTIADDGTETTGWIYQDIAAFDSMTVDRMLTEGTLDASVTVSGCVNYDSAGACTAYGDVGTVEIDLRADGVGPLLNDPSNAVGSGGWGGGIPGVYRPTFGGFAWTRAAALTGTVTLHGDSVIVGGSWRSVALWRAMGVQVHVSN
jgi:hypothetical protein